MAGAATARAPAASHRTLLAALLGMTAMLFAGFTAAYLERQAGDDWRRTPLPPAVLVNTAILAASSLTLEVARRRRDARWLGATLFLGFLFLAGQLLVWQQLARAGVLLPSSPHASFVYTLMAVHAVHLCAGIVALGAGAARPRILGLCAGFWHFVGGVWLYVLLVLLFV